MKTYQSHKKVQAAKIAEIVDDICTVLLFEDNTSLKVSYTWKQKHLPEVGGYFVKYADGYESYSPAEAFEEGYTECK